MGSRTTFIPLTSSLWKPLLHASRRLASSEQGTQMASPCNNSQEQAPGCPAYGWACQNAGGWESSRAPNPSRERWAARCMGKAQTRQPSACHIRLTKHLCLSSHSCDFCTEPRLCRLLFACITHDSRYHDSRNISDTTIIDIIKPWIVYSHFKLLLRWSLLPFAKPRTAAWCAHLADHVQIT